MKSIVVLVCVLLLSTTALSQTRSRTASKRGGSSAKTQKAPAQQAATEARINGAQRVADQVKTLTKFLYLMGGVAKGIEEVDTAARRNEASPTAIDQNNKNKATVKTSLQNVREGLDQLEIYFRGTPELQPYYVKLAGSAAGAAAAEDQAAAGHFDQAGRTLLTVVNRLADVLVAMR